LGVTLVSTIGNIVAQVAVLWYVITTGPAMTDLAAFFILLPSIRGDYFGGDLVVGVGFRRERVSLCGFGVGPSP